AFHDAAAVLIKDGELLAAIEEERLNRIKHTNCFPARAIKYCLDTVGCTLRDVDYIVPNLAEYAADSIEKKTFLEDRQSAWLPDGRSRLAFLFERNFGEDVLGKIKFSNHHLAHAWSAFLP